MTLVEHLFELRTRLFRCLIALFLGSVIAYVFYRPIFNFLTKPYCSLDASQRLERGRCALAVTGILDSFSVTLKLSLMVGVLLSSPFWLYQLWAFITPGLHRNERRWALSFVGTSIGLFVLGASFAYFTLGRGLKFLLSFADGLIPVISIDKYLSFVQAMLLIFGVSFEFPLLVVLLNLAGVVSYEKLRGWRRMEIFLVFVVSAFITPSGDPFTLTAMAVPLTLFYEVALLFARSHDKRVAKRDAALAFAGGAGIDETSVIDERPSDISTAGLDDGPDDDGTAGPGRRNA